MLQAQDFFCIPLDDLLYSELGNPGNSPKKEQFPPEERRLLFSEKRPCALSDSLLY